MAQGASAPRTPHTFWVDPQSSPQLKRLAPDSEPPSSEKLDTLDSSLSSNGPSAESLIYDEVTKHWTGEDWRREDNRLACLQAEIAHCQTQQPRPNAIGALCHSPTIWEIVGYRDGPEHASSMVPKAPKAPKSWAPVQEDKPKGSENSPRGHKRPHLAEPFQSFAFCPRFRAVDLMSDDEYEEFGNQMQSYSQKRPWFFR